MGVRYLELQAMLLVDVLHELVHWRALRVGMFPVAVSISSLPDKYAVTQ